MSPKSGFKMVGPRNGSVILDRVLWKDHLKQGFNWTKIERRREHLVYISKKKKRRGKEYQKVPLAKTS